MRVRNGEVCYWPNLGYGRFGAKVTMDDAPWFDRPDRFDPRRLRFADVDGSGPSDLLYLTDRGVDVYVNESGNRWSAPRVIAAFPLVDATASVQIADVCRQRHGVPAVDRAAARPTPAGSCATST